MPNSLVSYLRQSRPDIAGDKTDDELTVAYGAYYGVDQLSAQYPDWAADYNRIMADSARSQLTAGDYFKQAAGSVVRGAADTVASLPEAVAVASQAIDRSVGRPGGVGYEDNLNSQKPLAEYDTMKLGGLIREAGRAVSPENEPLLEDSFVATKTPQAVGSALGFMASGGAAGLGGKAMATAGMAMAGAASSGVEQFKDAIASGADEETALKAFLLGGAVGTSEVVPLNRMLRRLDGVSGGTFSKALTRALGTKLLKGKAAEITVEAARDAFEESLQEVFQSAAGNTIAADILQYDTDRKLTDGMLEDGAAGGVTGVVMSLLTQAIGRVRAPDGSEQPPTEPGTTVDPAPAAATVAPSEVPNDINPTATMGRDREQIRELAVSVVRGDIEATEAAGQLDQAVDQAAFREELGRLLAVQQVQQISPAPAPEAEAGLTAQSEPNPPGVQAAAGVVAPPPSPLTPEAAPEVPPAPEDPQADEYAQLHEQLKALVTDGTLTQSDYDEAAGALEEHRTFERTAGREGVQHPELITALTSRTISTPQAATPPDAPTSVQSAVAPSGVEAPANDRLSLVAQAAEQSAPDPDAVNRIDEQIAAEESKIEELIKDGGQYQAEMLARRPDQIEDTGAQKKLNQLQSNVARLKRLRERAGAGEDSRNILFHPEHIFTDATGYETGDRLKGGREAAGFFELNSGAQPTEDGTKAQELYNAYTAAPEEKKAVAADELASHLFSQGLPESGDRKLSRRAVAFRLPDGRYLVTLVKDTGTKSGSAPLSGKNKDGTPKRGDKYKTSIPRPATGSRGRPGLVSVAELLGAGAVPVASIRLAVHRGTFNHVYSAAEYAQFANGTRASQGDSNSITEAGAELAGSQQATGAGEVVADGELQARSGTSSGGSARLDDEVRQPAYTASSTLTPDHASTIYDSYGGDKGGLDLDDAKAVLEDSLNDDDSATRSAFRSLTLAAEETLSSDERFQNLSKDEQRDEAFALAAQWLADSSSGGSGKPGFASRLVQAAGRQSAGPGQAVGGGAEAAQVAPGGGDNPAVSEQSPAGTDLKQQLREAIQFLMECGVSASELDPKKPKAILERAAKLQREIDVAAGIRRDRLTEPSAPPVQVDLAGGTVTAPRVIATDVKGAVENLNRSEVSPVLVEAQAMTAGLQPALARIVELSTNPLFVALAKAIGAVAPNLQIRVSQTPGSFGRFSGNEITINPGPHVDAADVHRTVLEEAIHAVTAGWQQAYLYARETLTPAQIRLMEQANRMMEEAKAAGLQWQDMGDPVAGFDEFLAAIKTNTRFRASLEATAGPTSLWQRIKDWLQSLVRSFIGDRSLLAEADSIVDSILRQGPIAGERQERFRRVDGYLGEGGFESTADTQYDPRPDAQVTVAVANMMGEMYGKALTAYKAVSPMAAPLNEADFIQFVHETAGMSGMDAPDAIVDAVEAELNRQGLPAPGIRTTKLTDLDTETRGPLAMREGVMALQRLIGALNSRVGTIEETFTKEAARLLRLKTEFLDTSKQYDSAVHTERLLRSDMRRALNETLDRGSGAILKELGVAAAPARKAQIDRAAQAVLASPAAFIDAIEALSASGLNFVDFKAGTVTVADAVKIVQASPAPGLAPLKADIAMLALALNFGKRHSLLMDLLPAKSAPTERRALDTMIELAMSNRPDAFDAAAKQLGLLTRLGGRGARILETLRQAKAEFIAQDALIKRYQRILDAYPSVGKVFRERLESLQEELAAEVATEGDTSRQWSPSQGAIYYVPASPTTPASELLAAGSQNPHRRVLDLGAKFDFAQIREDAEKIGQWLKANPNFVGAGRGLLERTVSRDTGLLTVAAKGAIQNIRHGVSGMIFRYFGDLGVRMQTLGVHGAREASRQLRAFVSNMEAFGRGKDMANGQKADALMHAAMKETGIEHPADFKRRFYSDALGYLETRGDLNSFTPGVNPLDVDDRALGELRAWYFSKERPEDKALLEANIKAWPAIAAFLKQSTANNSLVQTWLKQAGLKIRDKDAGIFRAAIGRPWFTMSRLVSSPIRAVANAMAPEWRKPIDWASFAAPADIQTALQPRFTKEVWEQFVGPLAHKTGQAVFDGPEIGGVVDRASRANLIAAYTAAKGDFVTFAQTLYTLEGGTADAMPFIRLTYETLNRFFRELDKVSSTRDVKAEGDEIGRTFLDARQGSNYPLQWLEYRSYGTTDLFRYARILSAQAAFGNGAADFTANLDSAERELTLLAAEYEALVKMPKGAARDAEEKRLKATGNWVAYKAAAKNLEELKRVRADFETLFNEYRGDPAEYRSLTRTLGTIAGLLVQGVSTTLVDNVTLFEAPLRKFGLSRLALDMIAGNVRGYAGEALGSLMQAFGKDLVLSADWHGDTAEMNASGLADPDAWMGGYRDQYAARVANIPSTRETFRREGLGAAVVNLSQRATEAASTFISTGIGKAGKAGGYATLKPLAPFTMGSQFQHRAAVRGWLQVTRRVLNQAAAHMRKNPADAANPKFRFDYQTMGGSKFFGLFGGPSQRAWEYVQNTLESAGVSIEEAARQINAGEPALTDLQTHSIIALAQSEITLNTSAITRPTGTTGLRGLIANPVISPLLGWSIAKMADVAKTSRAADLTSGEGRFETLEFLNKKDAMAFGSAMTAFVLGVLPVSLAFAWLRDEYDEEIVGKKANVQTFAKDNAGFALVDRLARVGTFGFAGDVINSLVNFDTAREFSVDSRILALNTFHNLVKAGGTLIRQRGDVDYAGFYRPLLASLGGSGYLQNFGAINNLTGMDNVESRFVRRIHVGNLISASAKDAGIEVRSPRAASSTPSPMKPYVNQMVVSAYVNDSESFREAYRKAVEAARADGEITREEARKRVAASYAGQNPINLKLPRKPTQREWRTMLSKMDADQRSAVEGALNNFQHYGRRIGASVENLIAQPKAMTTSSIDWRSLTTTR